MEHHSDYLSPPDPQGDHHHPPLKMIIKKPKLEEIVEHLAEKSRASEVMDFSSPSSKKSEDNTPLAAFKEKTSPVPGPPEQEASTTSRNSTPGPKVDNHPKKRVRASREELANRLDIVEIVRQLTNPDGGKFPEGISPKDLSIQTNTFPEAIRPNSSKNHLQVQLCRLVTKGIITKLGQGLYTMTEYVDRIDMTKFPSVQCQPPVKNSSKSQPKMDPKSEPDLSGPEKQNGTVAPPTTTTTIPPTKKDSADSRRRKRVKKSMGKEFLTYSGSTERKGQVDSICDMCLMPASLSTLGVAENFVHCTGCSRKAHPSCVSPTKTGKKSPWTCSSCRYCCVCLRKSNGKVLAVCTICDRSFHKGCHTPNLIGKPITPPWVCGDCKPPVSQSKTKGFNGFGPSTVKAVLKTGLQSTLQTIDSDPPQQYSKTTVTGDLAGLDKWTTERVAEFLKGSGFARHALTFKEQEIDGLALVLLKRDDILSRMSLKLGPAVKLYDFIFAMQQQHKRLSTKNP